MSPTEHPRPSAVRALALLAIQLALAVWLSWPLGAHLRTSFPVTHFVSHSDVPFSAWVLAHASRALATHPTAIADAPLYHPSRGAFFYGPTALGAVPLFAPVFLATGEPLLALNATYLLGIALSAWTASLVVLRWTGSWGAAFVAGWTILVSPWTIRGMVATAPYVAALMYFPPIAYLAARRTTKVREALWLVPFVLLQCLVDLAYVAPAVLAPLGSLLVLRLLRRESRPHALPLAVALALSLVALSPVVAGYARVFLENPHLREQSVWAGSVPIPPLPLPSRFFGLSSRGVPPALVLLIVAGAASFLLRRRDDRPGPLRELWAHGLLWWSVGVLISLPSYALVAGRVVRLPRAFVASVLPGIEALRTPDRLGVAALIGTALLAGAAFAEAARRLEARRIRWGPPALLALVLVTSFVGSFHADPTHATVRLPMPIYQPIRWSDPALAILRAAPGAVLELPVPRDEPDPTRHARSMLRAIDHGRPLLNGYSSYYPKEFPERMRLAAELPAPGAVRALREQTGVAVIAVRLEDLLPRGRDAWMATAAAPPPGLRVAYQTKDELLFAVDVAGSGR